MLMKCDDEGELMPESNDDIGYINDLIKARKEGAKQVYLEFLKAMGDEPFIIISKINIKERLVNLDFAIKELE